MIKSNQKYGKRNELLKRLNATLEEEEQRLISSSFHAAQVYLTYFDKNADLHDKNFKYLMELF